MTEQHERLEIVTHISSATDAMQSVSVPKGSVEDTIAFLDNLFKGTYGQQPDTAQHLHG